MKVRSLVVGIAAALVAVACVTGAAARSARQSDVATAAAQIAAYANVPTFVAPGPAFNAAKAKGKVGLHHSGLFGWGGRPRLD